MNLMPGTWSPVSFASLVKKKVNACGSDAREVNGVGRADTMARPESGMVFGRLCIERQQLDVRRPHRLPNCVGSGAVAMLQGADQNLADPERARTQLIAPR